jgi:molybdopterin molybdotransferase
MAQFDPTPTPAQWDVRMRGFQRRSTVETVIAWIDAHTLLLPSETVSIWQAAGRTLAGAVASEVDVPAFDRAMMDGYALRAADVQGASSYNPLELRIIGESFPGRPFEGQVESGTAIRIMTGAPLPPGADAVLPAERAEEKSATLQALDDIPARKNIGRCGEDVHAGSQILPAGRPLRPQDLGLLSSIGIPSVSVHRRPRVRLIITGHELLPAGSKPHGVFIADANGPMLSALVERDGGAVINAPRDSSSDYEYLVDDNPDELAAALLEDADVVLVSGGSSVGREDHAPLLLAKHGELAIHGIAMRPSSPAGMGRIGNKLVFLLPGNPVSCLCAYDFFAGRAIRALGGRSREWPYRVQRLRLARKLVSTVGRVDYCRVRIENGLVEPISISGASVLSSTTRADGFVVIPADCEGYPPDAEVELWFYG